MLTRLLYQLALIGLATLSLPKLLIQKKYRATLKQRFGLGFPIITKGDKTLYWLHAVSVGETRALTQLTQKIKSNDPNSLILITNITETGHAEAIRSIPADYHLFLPFDLFIRPIIKRIQPDVVILCETDFWLNFLMASKECGAKLLLVNGKVSENSLRNYKRFSPYAKLLFGLFDTMCVQNEIYKDRFLSLGIPEKKLTVTGNLKYDERPQRMSNEEATEFKLSLGFKERDLVVVAGSTHSPEEGMLLKEFHSLWEKYPNLKLILVPRHPERFIEVEKMLRNIPYAKYTKLEKVNGDEKVILIDAMGKLRQCYQIADLAFVCGSFFPGVGGHNIIEPCHYGVPVLFGEYMYSQPDMEPLVLNSGAGIQLSPDQIPAVVSDLLLDGERRTEIGKSGLELVCSLYGATDRTLDLIQGLLGGKE